MCATLVLFHILRMYPGFLTYTPRMVMDTADAREVPVLVTSDTEDLVLELLAGHAVSAQEEHKHKPAIEKAAKIEESFPEVAPKGDLGSTELHSIQYDK